MEAKYIKSSKVKVFVLQESGVYNWHLIIYDGCSFNPNAPMCKQNFTGVEVAFLCIVKTSEDLLLTES